jgi:hypothetical protein
MLSRSLSTARTGILALALAFIAPAVFAQGGPGGGMGGPTETLSSEDVSEEEVDAAAEIIVAMQMQRQQMRTDMREKYGNPQEMDSTQRREARTEIMQKRQALMEKKTEEEDLSADRLGLIMKSARKDSTLRKRVRTAVQEKRKARMGGPGAGRGDNGRGANGAAPDRSRGNDQGGSDDTSGGGR